MTWRKVGFMAKELIDEGLSRSARRRAVRLDFLRVVAIVMVFTFHFPKFDGHSVFGPIGQYGWMGVDLFFVLSGFLIGSQIIKRMRSPVDFSFRWFYLSRALRTLPIYFLVVGLYLTWPAFREKAALPPLWRFLTFTQNFCALDTAFSHAWSLCIEEQFYLVCPIVVMLLVRLKSARVVITALISLILGGALFRHCTWTGFQAVMTPENKWNLYLSSIYYPTWGRLDGLALGVAVSALKELRPDRWLKLSQHRATIAASALSTFAIAIYLFTDRLSWAATVFGYPVLAASFALLLIFAATGKSDLARLRSSGVGQAAILSYSFYLIHKQVIHLLTVHGAWATTMRDQTELAAASFAVSLLSSFIMYQLVERPFLMVRDRLIASAKTVGDSRL